MIEILVTPFDADGRPGARAVYPFTGVSILSGDQPTWVDPLPDPIRWEIARQLRSAREPSGIAFDASGTGRWRRWAWKLADSRDWRRRLSGAMRDAAARRG